MPHPDLADRVMRQRDVIPPHRLPFLISTTTQDSFNPSLLARAHHASATPATSGPKPTSQLTTTVLPVVLGAGYVAQCPQALESETKDKELIHHQCPRSLCYRGSDLSAPEACQEALARRCQ